MASGDPTAFVNPPKQSRSRRTLERLVGAALDILEAAGPDGLTVQAIVERAGSSVGSFYARFSGKADLLEYLGERVWRDAAARWEEALDAQQWDGLELENLVRGAVSLLGQVGRSRTSYLKALDRAPGTRADAYVAFQAHVLQGIEELLLSRSDEIDHPAPNVAVPLGLRAAMAVLDTPDRNDPPTIPFEEKVLEAQRILLSYLSGRPSGDSETQGQVDFFDIWG
jgi:AcrR family transcriptional regulator